MTQEIAPLFADLGRAGVTLTDGVASFRRKRYVDWAVFPGRPHRAEFGDFLHRWALKRQGQHALLISGPSDRPVRSFLERVGVLWMEIPEWASFERKPSPVWSPSLVGRPPSLGQRGELTADVHAFGRPLLEQDMELFLDQRPKWLSEVLGEPIRAHPLGRQFRIARGRLDLLGIDRQGRTCIIECKRGALHTSYIGQIIEYERPDDAVVKNARLILLVNSANPAYDAALAQIGIEVRRFPIQSLVDAMRAERFTPRVRDVKPVRMRSSSERYPITPWKRQFVDDLRAGVPASLMDSLVFETDYKPPKKIACHTRSGASVFYVESNGPRLEICLTIVDQVLRAGGSVPFAPRSTHVVYFGKTSTLVTTAIRSDESAAWLLRHQRHVVKGLKALEDGLEPTIQHQLLSHLGAVLQNHNAMKGEADGVCRNGATCPYCTARGK